MKPAIRILLVDDQQLLRLGFRMLLETQADLEVVGEAGDGTEALRLVGQTGPDVVLMDVRMPGMDGIQATEQITTQYPQTRVLVLTTFDLDQYAFAALRAGASGFLLKNLPLAELVSAIRAVHSGDAVVAPSRGVSPREPSRPPGRAAHAAAPSPPGRDHR